MPTLRLNRIAQPGVLAKVTPDRLLSFLEPMREYLEKRGFLWPQSNHDKIDYEKLGQLLHFPQEGLPTEMVVPLVLVDEMSTDQQMDRLLEAASQQAIMLSLAGDSSPADVAVQVWLQARGLLEDLHAENHTIRQKNFCYFGGIRDQPRAFPKVGAERRRTLERDLDETFEHYKRGRGSRVFIFDHGREVWILVRRGATFRREESMEGGGEPGVQLYRPMMYDVLVYDTETDDLGLHVETKWQERLYLRCIGQYVFNDPDYFPAEREISFDPLVTHGARALSCGDVQGLAAVKLIEVQKRWNNAQNEVDIKKANDVFAALGERWRSFLGNGILTRIVFRVWFEGDKKPRTVALRWPNVTKYERDSDGALVQLWLTRRGYKPTREPEQDAAE